MRRTRKEGILYEIMNADDVVLITETMEELHNFFYCCKSEHESNGLRVNVAETKVVDCTIGQISKKTIQHDRPALDLLKKNNGKCSIV